LGLDLNLNNYIKGITNDYRFDFEVAPILTGHS
jgi:hypothetical protein